MKDFTIHLSSLSSTALKTVIFDCAVIEMYMFRSVHEKYNVRIGYYFSRTYPVAALLCLTAAMSH